MRKAIKAWVAVSVAASMSLMAGAGVASAAPGAPGARAGIQPKFAAQARAAGLSATQANRLQQEAARYISKYGGTQAALNVVDFRGGRIVFVVPGERYARDLATQSHVLAAASCAYQYFCAFNGTSYTRSELQYYYCVEDVMPWSTEGSYINNQTPGVRAAWYGSANTEIYVTPSAYSQDPRVDWAPFYGIKPC